MSTTKETYTISKGGRPEIIFVLGGPGAGKGTQCSLLANKYGFRHLSLGDILRKEVATPDSKWGNIISRNLQEGLIGSKEMTVELLDKAINDLNIQGDHTYLLIDGFPRSMDRAYLFEDSVDIPLCVLLLECEDATMRERLLARAEIEGRRDDNPEIIRKRLATFHHEDTEQVLQHYFVAHKLVAVDASGSQDEILANIEEGLSNYIDMVPKQHLSPAPTLSDPGSELEMDWDRENSVRISQEYVRVDHQ